MIAGNIVQWHDCLSVGLWLLTGPLANPRWYMNENGASVKWYLQVKTGKLREKQVRMQICPPQIPYRLPWAWTWALLVRSQWIITCALPCRLGICLTCCIPHLGLEKRPCEAQTAFDRDIVHQTQSDGDLSYIASGGWNVEEILKKFQIFWKIKKRWKLSKKRTKPIIFEKFHFQKIFK
jgi:hypothetical protein